MNNNMLYIGDDPNRDKPEKHNYIRKLRRLQKQGKIPKGEVTDVDIAHDDWCKIFTGGYCNCNPEITLRNT